MYVQQAALDDVPRPNRLITSFYFVLYVLLWLLHHIRKWYIAGCSCIELLFLRFLSSKPKYESKVITFPRHIALSGVIAEDIECTLSFALLAIAKGSRDITLYDPWRRLNVDVIVDHLRKRVVTESTWSIAEISDAETIRWAIRFSAVHADKGQTLISSDKRNDDTADVRLSIVRANTGRGALVRAARVLAAMKTDEGPRLNADGVTRWLDRDDADCMLPSEPDVVVVFPSEDPSRRAFALNGFPVWQLRLTQIRFSDMTVDKLSEASYIRMVSSAATAPKRFGR